MWDSSNISYLWWTNSDSRTHVYVINPPAFAYGHFFLYLQNQFTSCKAPTPTPATDYPETNIITLRFCKGRGHTCQQDRLVQYDSSIVLITYNNGNYQYYFP